MANPNPNPAAVPAKDPEEIDWLSLFRECANILRRRWKWFVLSVIVCLVLAFLYQQKQARVYQRTATVLVEDASGTGGSRRMSGNMNALLELNGITTGDQLQNEIFILQSHRLIERVVRNLKLDVDYTTVVGLRPITLYKNRPFEVSFLQAARENESVTFEVDLIDNNSYRLHDLKVYGPRADSLENALNVDKTLRYGQIVKTPVGDFVLTRTMDLKDKTSATVKVSRMPVSNAAEMWRSNLTASEVDKESSLINLTFQDTNTKRAEDFLNELLKVYKEDIIENKNRVAQSTVRFIDSRIILLGEELGDVEASLASFKERNSIVDFEKNAEAFLTERSAARQTLLNAEVELNMTQYLADFLKNNSKADQIIPVLIGISDQGIQSQISEYNTLLLERNKLAANTGENSPTMVDLQQRLLAMNAAIRSSVDSYVESIQLRVADARRNEKELDVLLSGVPRIEKDAGDIIRQQEVKSALYSYLLSKREEVAIQLAVNEANIRTVEYPIGPINPVAPHTMIILAVGLLLGILIPSAYFGLRLYFDTAVRGRKDVEEATNLPILGEIPRWEGVDKEGHHELLISSESGSSVVSEGQDVHLAQPGHHPGPRRKESAPHRRRHPQAHAEQAVGQPPRPDVVPERRRRQHRRTHHTGQRVAA